MHGRYLFGKDDLILGKGALVEEANTQVKDFEQQYLDGLITQGEKYNKVSTSGRAAPTRWLRK